MNRGRFLENRLECQRSPRQLFSILKGSIFSYEIATDRNLNILNENHLFVIHHVKGLEKRSAKSSSIQQPGPELWPGVVGVVVPYKGRVNH
jgi:hypothetical protein